MFQLVLLNTSRIQPDSEVRRGKWIAKIQKYDVEINPTKLVKGQGLEILLTESNFRVLGVNMVFQTLMVDDLEPKDPQDPLLQVDPKFSQSDWYKDIVFLPAKFTMSTDWDKAKVRSINMKVLKYCIIHEQLFWKDPSGILLNCITEEKTQDIINEFHKGVCGGHHA
jgi:hypothetical protein